VTIFGLSSTDVCVVLKEYSLLCCNTVLFGDSPTFQRKILPPYILVFLVNDTNVKEPIPNLFWSRELCNQSGITCFSGTVHYYDQHQSRIALRMQQVHCTRVATLQQQQLGMVAQNFETLHWSAENQGRRQKVANYAIAYGSYV
jgi:hypothetical protein